MKHELFHRIMNYIRCVKRVKWYNIDGFRIEVGYDHRLPQFQAMNPMYDRFLPILGECLDKDSTKYVIDVGANVGDTVASMIRHTSALFICIEADKKYYKKLEENVRRFMELSQRIKCVNAFVVSGENSACCYDMNTTKGTGVRVVGNHLNAGNTPSKTLAQIIEDNGVSMEDVALIKTDTDGYDYECLESLMDTLETSAPLLYWESSIETKEQFSGYVSLVKELSAHGYSCYYVFDNFGNYLGKTDGRQLESIFRYLFRIECSASTRTFYYVDVLAAKDAESPIAKKAVEKYTAVYDSVFEIQERTI